MNYELYFELFCYIVAHFTVDLKMGINFGTEIFTIT
jgi:hypothetical protein